MLSSLLRPRQPRARQPDDDREPLLQRSSFLSPGNRPRAVRHATADFTESENDMDEETEDDREDGQDHGSDDEHEYDSDGEEDDDDEEAENDEDGNDGESPLLPIFSAQHLDALPVYNITHAIRLIVLPRTETTLSWEQLRSPQVSQFLIKPMQQQIRRSHFSRATLYALMANVLQFGKEGQLNPGNAGNSRTRAMVCEILAMKLLKEYNIRELIDALSYDFDPLQGIAVHGATSYGRPAAARTSTLEVAIRAQAKHFLAHPLVVQQLEAIWAGMIVFQSAADNLHRRQPVPRTEHGYGAMRPSTRPPTFSPDKASNGQRLNQLPLAKTASIYNPRDASLFKLSRLRVPLYRQILSTCSLAILLGLHLAVLTRRSSDISTLELVFWLWSAGFMLDELVGFNEQGFSLYIMSFWNAFDLGILLLLILYYCMRIYGICLVDVGRDEWNSMAYDVLAANAVLLFPRLFSVLDHYRYFSQLLIAFRLMAMDLVAVFTLILIACSGFFVAFTLSFGKNEYGPGDMAYHMMQMLLGFTPAAWEAWPTYNPLGRAILVLFLFISHFLIVTILITVLTNSFLAIASNAHEEHQFLFAVNTISMVKNDALFSYVAPTNILAWMLAPLRYVLPFREFIRLNRYVIKITHFPLLFIIFAYEKVVLTRGMIMPTDLVEANRRGRRRLISFRDPDDAVYSPSVRVRQESVVGYQKDRALDEVFRLAPRKQDVKTANMARRKASNAVHNWMDQHEGIASSPPEDNLSTVDRLERRRLPSRTSWLGNYREMSMSRSVASDPADLFSTHGFSPYRRRPDIRFNVPQDDHVHQTDQDGDDELASHDEDDQERLTFDKTSRDAQSDAEPEAPPTRFLDSELAAMPSWPDSSASSAQGNLTTPIRSSPPKRRAHNRTLSTNTILYNPVYHDKGSSDSGPKIKSRPQSRQASRKHTPAGTGTNTPAAGQRSPKRPTTAAAKPRPIMPRRNQFATAPNRAALLSLDSQLAMRAQSRGARSSIDLDLASDLGLIDPNNPIGAVPSSFATQMAFATGMVKNKQSSDSTERMMARLLLARMKTLEESFQQVVKEVQQMRRLDSPESGAPSSDGRRLDQDKGKQRLRRRDQTTNSSANASKRNSYLGRTPEGLGRVAPEPDASEG